jgi:hypothetical protein
VAQDERVAHDVAAQVERAVGQAQRLVDLAGSSSGNGGRLGLRQDLHLGHRRARSRPWQVRVDVPGLALDTGPATDTTCSAAGARRGERLAARVGMEDELHEPGAVAQVDEDEPPWSRRRCTQPDTRARRAAGPRQLPVHASR